MLGSCVVDCSRGVEFLRVAQFEIALAAKSVKVSRGERMPSY